MQSSACLSCSWPRSQPGFYCRMERSADSTMCMASLPLPLSTAFHLPRSSSIRKSQQQEVGGRKLSRNGDNRDRVLCDWSNLATASCLYAVANDSGLQPYLFWESGSTPSLSSSSLTTASCRTLRPATAASDYRCPWTPDRHRPLRVAALLLPRRHIIALCGKGKITEYSRLFQERLTVPLVTLIRASS
jgi:hypothetical protein